MIVLLSNGIKNNEYINYFVTYTLFCSKHYENSYDEQKIGR